MFSKQLGNEVDSHFWNKHLLSLVDRKRKDADGSLDRLILVARKQVGFVSRAKNSNIPLFLAQNSRALSIRYSVRNYARRFMAKFASFYRQLDKLKGIVT